MEHTDSVKYESVNKLWMNNTLLLFCVLYVANVYFSCLCFVMRTRERCVMYLFMNSRVDELQKINKYISRIYRSPTSPPPHTPSFPFLQLNFIVSIPFFHLKTKIYVNLWAGVNASRSVRNSIPKSQYCCWKWQGSPLIPQCDHPNVS